MQALSEGASAPPAGGATHQSYLFWSASPSAEPLNFGAFSRSSTQFLALLPVSPVIADAASTLPRSCPAAVRALSFSHM